MTSQYRVQQMLLRTQEIATQAGMPPVGTLLHDEVDPSGYGETEAKYERPQPRTRAPFSNHRAHDSQARTRLPLTLTRSVEDTSR